MSTDVIIVGAGGHGQVVADILLGMRRHGEDIRPTGYVDDNPALHNKIIAGLPVLGARRDCAKLPHDAIIIAVGDNPTRKRIFDEFSRLGEEFIIALHPTSIIAPGVHIGSGSMIVAGAVVNTGSEIGEDVILNTSCTIDHHSHVGSHSHVGPGANVGGDVKIQSGVLIGMGAIIMPGITIHTGATVGAGSMVRTDVSAGSTVVGVPARLLR